MPTDFWILIVVLIWGSVFSVIKFSLAEISPLAFATMRFVATSVLMLAILWRMENPATIRRPDWLRVALVGVTAITLYHIFFTIGIDLTTASNSSLLIATAPVFTVLFGGMLREEKITWRQVGGIILSFLGVILIVRASGTDFSIGSQSLLGDLLSLGAAAGAAMSAVLAKSLLKNYSSLRMMTWAIFAGTILLIPFGLPSLASQNWGQISFSSWLGLGYAVVFSSVIAYVLWFRGIGELGPTKTMVYGNFIPVVAVIIAALTLGEVITWGHILGGGIVLAGVTVTRLSPAPKAAIAHRVDTRG